MLFGGDGTHCFARKSSRDYEKEKTSPFFQEFSPPITTKHIRTWTKKGQIRSKYGINVTVSYWLMIWATYSISKSFNFNLQLTYTQHIQNYHDLLSLQRLNPVDYSKWSRPKFNNQLTKIPQAAWHLLLFQRQDFSNNHLALVPVTSNQEGTFEMREEVLSSVGAQDLDTSSYQLSDLEDIEFNWEDSQLDMDRVFIPGIDNPFLHQLLTIYWWTMDQLKTPLCCMKKRTRKTLLLQQHPSLSDPPNIPGCREVELLEQEKKCSWLHL